MEKQKWVLILDGMRETFDIQKLGVPVWSIDQTKYNN
jgi:hypothetical protein